MIALLRKSELMNRGPFLEPHQILANASSREKSNNLTSSPINLFGDEQFGTVSNHLLGWEKIERNAFRVGS
jgi:hypothetical protein